MSLSYHQIIELVSEVSKELVGKVLTHISELPPRKFILNFDGKFLLLCFQDPFLRFHLTLLREGKENSDFSKDLNKHLSGTPLQGVEILNQDRILAFQFTNYQLIAEFFPKRPNCYLTKKDGAIISSLNPTVQTIYQAPIKGIHDAITSTPVTSQAIEVFYRKLERESEFLKRKVFLEKTIKRQKRRLINRKKNEENALEKALKWKEIQHEALLLQSNLYQIKKGLEKIRVVDWEQDAKEVEITLDTALEPKEELSKRFLRARKLKASIPYIKKEIEKVQKGIFDCESTLQKISLAKSIEDLDFLEEPLKKAPSAEALPYREYTSASGLKIWVGKSAAKNDQLTFRYARGSDWWLHVSGFAGSHVILKTSKGKEPDHEALQDAIQLALHYSKAKPEGGADVCMTQRKYVSRLGKNAPGKVQISKHKIVYAKLDEERFKKLKEKKTHFSQ